MSLLDTPPVITRPSSGARVAVTKPDIEVIADEVTETREHVAARYTFAVARISLGFVFFWAFLDKMFGFDYATSGAKAWINGGSPSTGYLSNVEGPFADAFHSIVGTPADYLFMVGLFGIGLALTLGIGMRIAAASGALLLTLMWMASLPIATNPFMDYHLVYAVVLIGLALMHAGNTAGLGKVWNRLPIVKRFPVLV